MRKPFDDCLTILLQTDLKMFQIEALNNKEFKELLIKSRSRLVTSNESDEPKAADSEK